MDNALYDAISMVEHSEGDVTNEYRQILIRKAQLRLQISIAQSLEKIAEELTKLRQTTEEKNDRDPRIPRYDGF